MRTCLLTVLVFFLFISTHAQQIYYPGSEWEVKKPGELTMNQAVIDSAVSLALKYENRVERDLRIANIKSYSREPDYKIIGPMKQRGGPAGAYYKKGIYCSAVG